MTTRPLAGRGFGDKADEANRPVSGYSRAGFTLVELLVVIGVVGVLASLLLPALGGAYAEFESTQCRNNLRIIGAGIRAYAGINRGLFPPLAVAGTWPAVYWWGQNGSPPDFQRSPLVDYMDDAAGEMAGLFECPAQPWGTYIPQGQASEPTTTYGYNGYYLCPAATPGWSFTIGHRPWRTLGTVRQPARVFMLGDTLMSWGGGVVTSNCLLDPPWTFSRSRWRKNTSTTLCFRHAGKANVCFVDGHVEGVEPTEIVDAEARIGYVGQSNAPHYVPDYEDW